MCLTAPEATVCLDTFQTSSRSHARVGTRDATLSRTPPPASSGPVRSTGAIGRPGLAAKALVGQAGHLADQILGDRFESIDQGAGLIELAAGRKVFEVRRQVTGRPWRTPRAARRACERPRAAAARPGPGRRRPPRPVVPAHRSGNRGTSRAAPPHRRHRPPARRPGRSGVCGPRPRAGPGPAGNAAARDQPVDGRGQLRGPDRLREVVVHAGREAALAVFLPRPRRQGDDGQVSPRGAAPAPDRRTTWKPSSSGM